MRPTSVMTPPRLDHNKRHVAWTVDRGHEGFTWNRRLRLGRTEVGYHLHRHTSPAASDRWVLQPWLRYDRKNPA